MSQSPYIASSTALVNKGHRPLHIVASGAEDSGG